MELSPEQQAWWDAKCRGSQGTDSDDAIEAAVQDALHEAGPPRLQPIEQAERDRDVRVFGRSQIDATARRRQRAAIEAQVLQQFQGPKGSR